MGISNFQAEGPDGYIRDMFLTQGKVFFVRPNGGAVLSNGRVPKSAFKSLNATTGALSKCTTNANDRVYLMSESNTAATTTDYQTASLDWNLNGVNLSGICAGGPYNKRARIAWSSAAASASDVPLVKVSGNNCHISNISIVPGSATDDELSFGLEVTGDQNRFDNVDIPFPTNALNDVAGAYALKINGCDNTSFHNCTFGSYTVDLGSAANQLLLIDGGCSMVEFVDCTFIARLESTTNSPFVRLADATSVGFGCIFFTRCRFISTSVGAAYAQAGAFKTTAAQTDGRIVLTDCWTNAAKWDVDDADMILNGNTGLPIGDTAGVTLAV